MPSRSNKSPLCFVIYLIFVGEFSDGFIRQQRSSDNGGSESQNGFQNWGGVCKAGKKQSPINIKLGEVIVKNFPSFEFDSNYEMKQAFMVKNNGHTIHVSLPSNKTKPSIYGGGLGGKFNFEQLHFHWESEHEFDGKRADLEMHMVHYNSKYKNFAEASMMSDGIVVFAVLFDTSEEDDDEGMEKFFSYITEALSHDVEISSVNLVPGKTQDDSFTGHRSFSLRDLLPKDVAKFFRYDGSLTTPNCNEVVQWTIFVNRFFVSNETLSSFRMLQDHHNQLLKSNNRPPQELNSRQIYVQLTNQYNKPNRIVANEGDYGKKLSVFTLILGFLLHVTLSV